jgi:hypothetical protein
VAVVRSDWYLLFAVLLFWYLLSEIHATLKRIDRRLEDLKDHLLPKVELDDELEDDA